METPEERISAVGRLRLALAMVEGGRDLSLAERSKRLAEVADILDGVSAELRRAQAGAELLELQRAGEAVIAAMGRL